jgi:hypothetical protein
MLAEHLAGDAAAVDILLRGVPQRVALKTRRRKRMQQWRKGGGGMRRLPSAVYLQMWVAKLLECGTK